jgi:cytochrome c556
MLRGKLLVALATMVGVGVLGFGLSAFGARKDDPESELGKLMEKVQASNTVILKGVRKADSYKKQYEEVVKASKDLVEYGKASKPFTEPAKENKKPQELWEKLCDEFVVEAEKFAGVVGKAETTQVEAKNAYKAVQASCTKCHDDFRVEE